MLNNFDEYVLARFEVGQINKWILSGVFSPTQTDKLHEWADSIWTQITQFERNTLMGDDSSEAWQSMYEECGKEARELRSKLEESLSKQDKPSEAENDTAKEAEKDDAQFQERDHSIEVEKLNHMASLRSSNSMDLIRKITHHLKEGKDE